MTERVIQLLPPNLQNAVFTQSGEWEELRLRLGQCLSLRVDGREYRTNGRTVTEHDLDYVLEKATGASFQSAETQIKKGYVMAAGGIRIGLCGAAIPEKDGHGGLRNFSSLCIRIPHEYRGCADAVFDKLRYPNPCSALIYSPPGIGKTTLLRELTRRFSESGLSVAVADERGEIAGRTACVSGFDLGPSSDVMTGMEKSKAVMQMIRTMSPQVVVMDEISEPGDAEALTAAAGCGAALLATVHGDSLERLLKKPYIGRLLNDGVFDWAIGIKLCDGKREYEPACL